MKSVMFAFGVLAASIASAANTQWVGSGIHATTAQPTRSAGTHTAPVRGTGALQFFTDQPSFDTAVGDPSALSAESFDEGAADFEQCSEPVGSASNDSCFTPGELVGGFALTSSSGAGIVLLPAEFLGAGQTSPVVGAITFADTTNIAFSPSVTAVSAQVYGGQTPNPVDIEVFDENGVSLGTTTVTPAAVDAPVFFGVISATAIGQIVLTAENDDGELFDDLRFGAAGPSTPDEIFTDGFETADTGTCEPAQLFADPSFEATDPGSFTNPDWTSEDSVVGTSFCDATCDSTGTIVPHTGSWFVWFGGFDQENASLLSQSVTFPSGQPRWLNFWLINQIGGDPTATLTLSIDGTQISSVAASATPEQDYSPQALEVPATYLDGQAHVVEFDWSASSTNGEIGGAMIDDVTLDCTAQPTSAPGHVKKRTTPARRLLR